MNLAGAASGVVKPSRCVVSICVSEFGCIVSICTTCSQTDLFAGVFSICMCLQQLQSARGALNRTTGLFLTQQCHHVGVILHQDTHTFICAHSLPLNYLV